MSTYDLRSQLHSVLMNITSVPGNTVSTLPLSESVVFVFPAIAQLRLCVWCGSLQENVNGHQI